MSSRSAYRRFCQLNLPDGFIEQQLWIHPVGTRRAGHSDENVSFPLHVEEVADFVPCPWQFGKPSQCSS
jgi:hypothetical protein